MDALGDLARGLLLGSAVRRTVGVLGRALHQHDALAARVAYHVALRVDVAHALEHDAATQPLHLVHRAGPAAGRVTESEAVAVQPPGAGAVGHAGLLAVDRDRQRQPAPAVLGAEHRAARGARVPASVAVGPLGSALA